MAATSFVRFLEAEVHVFREMVSVYSGLSSAAVDLVSRSTASSRVAQKHSFGTASTFSPGRLQEQYLTASVFMISNSRFTIAGTASAECDRSVSQARGVVTSGSAFKLRVMDRKDRAG